jgi:hypothetical protein
MLCCFRPSTLNKNHPNLTPNADFYSAFIIRHSRGGQALLGVNATLAIHQRCRFVERVSLVVPFFGAVVYALVRELSNAPVHLK